MLLLILGFAGCQSGGGGGNPPPDTTAPTVPASFTATAASNTQINLAWTASTDNVGVTGYKVERCQVAGCSSFAQVATPSGTSFSDTGLAASTSYSYRVRAADAANNLSGFSSTKTTSTLAAPDTTPPSPPTILTATAASSSQINLSWTASTDNVAVTGYKVERCQGASCSNFAPLVTQSGTTFNDVGLTAFTSYSYRVRATDAANNLSGFSATATATTQASGPVTVSISPKRSGLTLGQKLAFTATLTNDTQVTWSASGSSCSGATCGTFSNVASTTATYTAPATAGIFTVTATSVADVTKSAFASLGVTDLAGVFTWHNDNARTGQNLQEYALTTTSVTGATFGKLFSCPVDGQTYAQPLYMANLSISGGTHNVVFAATENDSVYAFDADMNPCQQYWKKNYLGAGVTPIPAVDTGETDDLGPNIGITGTPVIDSVSKTLYVVTATKEIVGAGCSSGSPCYFRRLHALDLATGNEKFAGPVVIQATASGNGDTSDVNCPVTPSGVVAFCALKENQRPALLLLNNKLYIAFASHGDQDPYHGWVLAYDASALTQTAAFNNTPNGGRGGIWMSGAGPAADANSNIYVISGNGTFDTSSTIPPSAPNNDFGNSFMKLSTTSGLTLVDFFTTFNQASLNPPDLDVGSGGALVLPDSVGSAMHPHLLVGGDKQGNLYLLDRDNMGRFTSGGPDNIVQRLSVVAGGTGIFTGIFCTPAYWQGHIYFAGVDDVARAYSISNANPSMPLSTTPSSSGSDAFGFPGSSPSISALNTSNGIVWMIDSSQNGSHGASLGPAVLRAYNATNLVIRLYSSAAKTADAAGTANKFAVPTVANGKVYIGTQTELTVYGLLPN